MAAALQAALAASSPVVGEVRREAAEAMAVDEPAQRHQGKEAAVAALPHASTPTERALMDMIKSMQSTIDGLQQQLARMTGQADLKVSGGKNQRGQTTGAPQTWVQIARASAPQRNAQVHAAIRAGVGYVPLAHPAPSGAKTPLPPVAGIIPGGRAQQREEEAMQWVRANKKSKQGQPRKQQQWHVAPGKGSPSTGAPRAVVQPTKRPKMGTPCQPVPSVLRQWASQLRATSVQPVREIKESSGLRGLRRIHPAKPPTAWLREGDPQEYGHVLLVGRTVSASWQVAQAALQDCPAVNRVTAALLVPTAAAWATSPEGALRALSTNQADMSSE